MPTSEANKRKGKSGGTGMGAFLPGNFKLSLPAFQTSLQERCPLMLRGNYCDDDLTCLRFCERKAINVEHSGQPHRGRPEEKGSGMVLRQAGFLPVRTVLLLEEKSRLEGPRPVHLCNCKVLSESLALSGAGMRKNHRGEICSVGWEGT